MRVPLKAFIFQGTRAAGAAAEHLQAIGALKLSPEQKVEHDHLYGCLSILDSKAAALLQFDAILIATSTIALSIRAAANAVSIAVIVVALILATASSAITLRVITLFWTEASALMTPEDYLDHLLDVRDERTVCYRLAWLGASLSLLFLLIGAILVSVL